ncbi:MAG: response regulator, partial [Sulfurovum sp.]|nr:response regulator [Sulfurovum sp.]
KIAVKDSGIGLSKAQQKKIFDAYAQASASTNRTAGGTGLGLTISRKIVHSMGGELSVESEEGNGATFYFTITLQEANKAPVTTEKKSLKEVIAPVKKEVLDNGELATKEVHKAPVKIEEKSPKEVIVPVKKEVLDSGKLTVLVAEDNPINQKLIRIVFEKLGMKATLVDNGQKALEARQAEDFDLIFMDVQMPVMDGVEATHAILAYEKEHGLAHVPIIALTANALPGDREKYIKEGMDDYATKPLDVKVIEELRDKYCKKT